MRRNSEALVLLTNPMTFDIRPLMIARSLSQSGFKVNALCWDREGGNPEFERVQPNLIIRRFGWNTPYSQSNSKLLGILLYYFWCFFITLSLNPRIIVCNDIDTLPLGIFLKILKLHRPKVIFDMHDHPHIFLFTFPFHQILENIFLSMAKLHADHIIVVNDGFVKYLSSIGFDSSNITCIMNVSVLENSRISVRPSSKQLTIFYYGAISKERGVDILCSIILGLHHVTLILAGKGDLEEYAKALADSKKNIHYVGWLSNDQIDKLVSEGTDAIAILTDRYYVSSPITHTLASPRKLFTGMAKGLPVLVSEGAFMSEVVERYKCGVVLDFKDISKCKKDIELLRDMPNFRKELGENGFNAAVEHFNWNLMEKRLRDLWSRFADSNL
jgi:glycosyltransferase involved in cell wall biosynthesis